MSQTEAEKEVRDDYDLMSRILVGERDAMEQLYDRYSGVVLGLCLNVLGNRQDGEDCVIDIFMELWQRADRYDPTRSAPLPYILMLSRS